MPLVLLEPHRDIYAAKLAPGFWSSVLSPSIGFIFIVGRPRTHVISRCDFGSRVYLSAQWEVERARSQSGAC